MIVQNINTFYHEGQGLDNFHSLPSITVFP